MSISYDWRGEFRNAEVNELHAAAFGTRVFSDTEWNWRRLVSRHSLGWVTARDGERLVGFVNVIWDGFTHAWLEDTMVASHGRRRGIGTQLVAIARDQAKDAGCEWLHVDFADDLKHFYLGACGFTATTAGVIALRQSAS